MTTPDPATLIDRLCDHLSGRGWLTDPTWRAALHAVPRHLFVPPTGWAIPDTQNTPGYRIDRSADPATWWDAVYTDTSIITQVDDDPTADASTGQGRFTSSVSAPSVVVMFGQLLQVRDHDRILEIGTGSGWTAALTAHLAGPHGHITTAEIDPDLSARASTNLKHADLTGAAPIELVAGDAAALPTQDLGPFDRVHVTCGVTDIPWSWVQALRPGGVAAIPWCPPYGVGNQLRLTRTGLDHATGTLHGSAGYMMLRSQRPDPGILNDFLHHWDDRKVTTTRLDPRTVARDDHITDWATTGSDVAINALAPGIRYDLCHAGDGSGEATLWLRETFPGARETGSWALAEYVPGRTEFEVHTYGPRDLWAEVSDAYLTWAAWGRPDRNRFGLTLTPDHTTVWLDHPTKPFTGYPSGEPAAR